MVLKLQKGLLDYIKTFQGDHGCGMKLLKLEILISNFKYVLFSQNQSAWDCSFKKMQISHSYFSVHRNCHIPAVSGIQETLKKKRTLQNIPRILSKIYWEWYCWYNIILNSSKDLMAIALLSQISTLCPMCFKEGIKAITN